MTDCQAPFDIDALIDTLPRHRLLEPVRAPKRYRQSNRPLLKSYNGFTGIERRRGGQLLRWLQDAGCLAPPTHCDICGRQDGLQSHSENYYDMLRSPVLCRSCHRALHLRPWQWGAWRRITDAAAVTGHEWFALLPRHGIDIAMHLRSKWGSRVMDVECSPIRPFPDAIAVLLPGNLLHHPDL